MADLNSRNSVVESVAPNSSNLTPNIPESVAVDSVSAPTSLLRSRWRPRTRVLIALALSLLLVILAGGGVGIWLIVRKKQRAKNKPKTTAKASSPQTSAAALPSPQTSAAIVAPSPQTSAAIVVPHNAAIYITTNTKKPKKPKKTATTTTKKPKTPSKKPKNTSKKPGSIPSYKGGDSGAPVPIGPWPWSKNKAPWFISWMSKKGGSMDVVDGALRIRYVKGGFSSTSGAAFKANPHRLLPATKCTLNYSVFFPADFDPVKGGKLPGLCMTAPGSAIKCSTGGKWSHDAGSFRLMFRAGMNGGRDIRAIGYAYMALGDGPAAHRQQPADVQRVMDKVGRTGIGLWHDRATGNSGMRFTKGQWNTVSMTVVLNTPGQADGVVSVTVNGDTRAANNIVWRASDKVQISEVNFVSFFGGGDASWSATQDTYTLYKDVSVVT